jgi:competence ComEA-like helix-hairpin-helix protein
MRILIASATLVLVTAMTTGTASPIQAPAIAKPPSPALTKNVGDLTVEEEQEFAAQAEATLERVCIQCHPMENITKTRRSMRDWSDQVTQMGQRGAPGTEADLALVRKYMTRYYGLVRVNSATAEELSAVLGLPAKAATAIVEYRKANGRITDRATLAKVAGIDKTKLDEQPEALVFD